MKKSLTLISFLFASFFAFSQAPANDNCNGAISITSGVSCSYTNGTVKNATQSLSGCAGSANDDVWFKFVANTTSHYIEVGALSSDFDVVFEVFNASCNGSSLLCKDNSSSNTESATLTGLNIGSTYYVRVYSYSSSIPSNYAFGICIKDVVTPTITLTNQSNIDICAGNTISVPFTSTNANNSTFYLELSDSSGSFTNPTSIGNGSSSPITGTIPASTIASNKYKVRVQTYSSSYIYSPASTYLINIKSITVNLVSTNGTSYTAVASGGQAPYTYSLNGITYSSNNVFTNLTVGSTYTVYSKDANNCSGSLNFTINNPSKCNVLTNAGETGTTFTTHTLGFLPGLVTATYDMYSIPDQMEIYYNGSLVASTNGLVSDAGTLTFQYNPIVGGPNFCTIKLYAPNDGTAWEYLVGCPENVPTGVHIASSPSTVKTCESRILSPNYPANYDNNTDITQTFIPATSGKKLELSFAEFSTESYDKVYVYDGTSTSATLIGTYYGSGTMNKVTATNASGALTIRFTADVSSTYKGWVADLKCVDPIIYTGITNTTITTCDAVITSPNYPLNYVNSDAKTMTILPAINGNKVKINFLDLNTESYDKLYVYDGTTTSATLLATVYGSSIPSDIIASNSNVSGALTLKFETDITDVYKGWAAKVSCTEPSISISNTPVSSCNYTFSSPNYPGDYSNSTSIVQTISPSTPGSKLTLTFSDFNLESSYDYVNVYDGTSISANKIATLTGTTLPGSIKATNSSGVLTVEFTTDGSGRRSGFKANASCNNVVINSTDISNTPVTLCTNNITSPGYPNNYTSNLNITQVITPATPSKMVKLTFEDFNLEYGFDVLNVYNGNTTSSTLLRALSGTVTNTSVEANNATGQLTLNFLTDNETELKGFNAQVSCVDKAAGLEEIGSFKSLTYYPNPTSGNLNVKGLNFNGEKYHISLINSVGTVVLSQIGELNGSELNTVINLNELPSGLYIMNISDDNSSGVYRIVKN
jgi:hypothetical protein